jgi:hypothetical protein
VNVGASDPQYLQRFAGAERALRVLNQQHRRLHSKRNQSYDYETKKIQITQTEVICFDAQDVHKVKKKTIRKA